jgi:hypothetical protein
VAKYENTLTWEFGGGGAFGTVTFMLKAKLELLLVPTFAF